MTVEPQRPVASVIGREPALGRGLVLGQDPVTGIGPERLSPYRLFSRDEWAQLRAETPLTLTSDDVSRLQSLNDPISIEEVVAIYLPLSRLLSLYVAATQGLFKATQRFLLAEHEAKVPYIIGVAGSVAVGKSTTARVLKALLARWPNTPKVDLITTDGFLHPNAELKRMGAMERKGFPESYDTAALLRFLTDIKAGKKRVAAPLYSHLVYDVVPGEERVVESPDILIVEGLNVLQPARLPRDGTAIPFVSDFFDFSIYLDGHEDDLHRWYVNRLPAPAPDRLPGSALVFPEIRRGDGGRGPGDRRQSLDHDQPAQLARQHPADATTSEPDPGQGREPPYRERSTAAVVKRPMSVVILADTPPPPHTVLRLAIPAPRTALPVLQ